MNAPPAGAAPAPPPPSKKIYSGPDCTVTQTTRGQTTLLTFVGTCSPALREWLAKGFRTIHGSIALQLRDLVMIDAPFVREILFHARDRAQRKQTVALVAPPERMLQTLDVLGARDRFQVLASEQALSGTGSLAQDAEKERQAVAEVAALLDTNPLWRRVDRDHLWLCPLCGTLVEDVKIANLIKPGLEPAVGVRRHLAERCTAWRAGNATPLAASILDARLKQINERKMSASAERTQILSRQVEALQGRVENMESLERDVRKAQRRQLHMLPIEPEPDEAVDIAVVYRPADAIGGDFLDFYALESNHFGVAIGDVSGHGVEAAILMGIAKKTLRIRARESATIRQALEQANRDLHEELRRTAFVTAFYARIDRTTRKLTYARAGHPLPLLRRASGPIEELNTKGLPLGVDEGKRFGSGLEEGSADLAPGDVILLYTDGVIEAGESGHEFGLKQLRETLQTAPAEEPAEKILRHVVAALDAFMGSAPQDDDVTLVCLKVK